MPHPFNCFCGKELSRMSASWFVSYCFYDFVSRDHLNWSLVGHQSRLAVYNRTRLCVVELVSGQEIYLDSIEERNSFLQVHQEYESVHRYWLKKILRMNANRLNKNSIELRATQIYQLARQCLLLL